MNLASSSEPKPRLRERLRSATRDAILAAAADVFAADGAANARIEDIAARAGVAVGTVYNYFEDRAALVAALLDVRTKSLLEALDEDSGRSRSKGGRGPSAAFAGELDRFVATLAGHFDTNRGLLTVLLDEHLARGMHARDVSRRQTVMEQILVRAERLMAKGIRTQALRKDDPSIYAALLVGMVRGLALSSLPRREARLGDAAGLIGRVFLAGAAR